MSFTDNKKIMDNNLRHIDRIKKRVTMTEEQARELATAAINRRPSDRDVIATYFANPEMFLFHVDPFGYGEKGTTIRSMVDLTEKERELELLGKRSSPHGYWVFQTVQIRMDQYNRHPEYFVMGWAGEETPEDLYEMSRNEQRSFVVEKFHTRILFDERPLEDMSASEQKSRELSQQKNGTSSSIQYNEVARLCDLDEAIEVAKTLVELKWARSY